MAAIACSLASCRSAALALISGCNRLRKRSPAMRNRYCATRKSRDARLAVHYYSIDRVQPPHRLAQRSRGQQKAVAEAALPIDDRNFELARERSSAANHRHLPARRSSGTPAATCALRPRAGGRRTPGARFAWKAALPHRQPAQDRCRHAPLARLRCRRNRARSIRVGSRWFPAAAQASRQPVFCRCRLR